MEDRSKKRLLFVCLGNICRSPAAEAVANQYIEEHPNLKYEYIIDSAGLHSYHSGEKSDPRMISHASKRGIALTSRSREITYDDIDKFDLIIAMDESNAAELYRRAPTLEASRKIVKMMSYRKSDQGYDHVPDPYYGGSRGFDLVLDLLDDAVEGLFESLESE